MKRRYPTRSTLSLPTAGATDRSTASTPLAASCRLRALLVKTGPGRLSAQMRMALAYALDEGYEGIIFIDGNNKDDPSGINRFIERLDQGFDHIQGSRFVKGGKAVNTPFLRRLGGRLCMRR